MWVVVAPVLSNCCLALCVCSALPVIMLLLHSKSDCLYLNKVFIYKDRYHNCTPLN